jgi:hypothetical protein
VIDVSRLLRYKGRLTCRNQRDGEVGLGDDSSPTIDTFSKFTP